MRLLTAYIYFRANMEYNISTKVGDVIMKKLEELIDKSGIILTRDVVTAGIAKHTLYKFLEEHNFEKVAHGIYASPQAWEDRNYILSLRYPQCVFSHDEALYYHGLVDREPMYPTVTLYTGYGTSRLTSDGIKVFTVKKELVDLGKEMYKTPLGHLIPMYNLERTLCDLVRSRSYFEIQDYQTALKTYSRLNSKNLNRLMDYAAQFHVDKKIREYMEVML